MRSVLDFLQAYKELDELCKNTLFPAGGRGAKGISGYIEEMERFRGEDRIEGLQEDCKKLKHLRYVRNKLVHESDSFEKSLFTEEDIRFLKRFRARVNAGRDPLALLRKQRKAGSPLRKGGTTRRRRRKKRRGAAKSKAWLLLPVAAALVGLLWYFLK